MPNPTKLLFMFHKPSVAFAPAALSGLVLWADPTSGLLQETTGASATTAAGAGNPIGTWAMRTAQYVTAASSGVRPTNTTTGLQPDATDDQLDFASRIDLGTGDFTIYLVGTAASGANWLPLGSPFVNGAVTRFTDNNLYLVDNGNATVSAAYAPAGKFALRLRRSSGVGKVAGTGLSETTGPLPNAIGFDCMFARPVVAQRNNSTSNRYRTMLIFDRYLSASETSQVESWLTTTEGVTI